MSNSYYYGITIGPVVDTLALSSKPLGLWVASYMFSEVVYQICESLREKHDVKFLSPHFERRRSTSPQGAVGKYHDRIIFKSKGKLIDIAGIINSAKGKVITELNLCLNFDSSYIYCRYIKVHEHELANKNIIKYMGAKLDALELQQGYFDVDSITRLRELLGDNNKIKKTCLYKKCLKSLKEDVNLVKNGNIRELNDICNSKYYAILQADGDGVGSLLSQLENTKISKFSKCLFDYADELAKCIKEYGGSLIYAGGDDVLAIVPLWTSDNKKNILELCHDINQLFINKMEKFLNGHSDGVKLSVSFGIAIYYHKFPLYEAFKESVNQLFYKAKKYKNCIAIYAQKHSGQYFKTIIQNSNNKPDDCLNAIIQSIKHSTVKSNTSYIYHLMREKELFKFAIQKSIDEEKMDTVMHLFKNYFDNINQISNQDLQGNLEFVEQLITMKKNTSDSEQIIKDIIQIIRFRKFLQEVKTSE